MLALSPAATWFYIKMFLNLLKVGINIYTTLKNPNNQSFRLQKLSFISHMNGNIITQYEGLSI